MHTIFAPTCDPDPAATQTPLRGVALVIHGLNVNPARLLPLTEALCQRGIGVVLCSLRGHGENYTPIDQSSEAVARLAAFRQVHYQDWSAEVMAAYEAALACARPTNAPLFLVAYSLGALLGCNQVVASPSIRFDRMVLLAPALALHPYCYLPLLLMRWPQLTIRSLAPSTYRANPATPVAAYQALFTALRHVHQQANAALNCPTLLLIDPADELVSLTGLRRFIHQHGLDQWQLRPVHKARGYRGPTVHHLIIDPESVGAATWQQMIEQIAQHLLGKSGNASVDESING